MCKLTVVGVISLVCWNALAEPELKGTATELAQYLSSVPKTVAISGEAEVRVPAHRAVLTLKVVTESKSLQEAMRMNLDFRNRIADQLKKVGIPADRIQSSRFSSTPKFGIFSEKAKSYRIENLVRIVVQDEKEFQSGMAIVDLWPEVQFAGVEFEYGDKEALKKKALAEACDKANERKTLYEEKLGLKLTPATFTENPVVQRNAEAANYVSTKRAYAVSSVSGIETQPDFAGTDESVSSFGELVYTARVTVEYTAQVK
jgi:uncharacterized protein YggE